MSKRAEKRALEAYPDTKTWVIGISGPVEATSILREKFQEGYEQAEKDLADVAAFSSGLDGFYYGKGYQQGKKDAEKDLGLHSVDESLPPVDEEVIVLTDIIAEDSIKIGLGRICFAHIVNSELTVEVGEISYTPMSYNGWNIPGVKYWMPMPKLPNEE